MRGKILSTSLFLFILAAFVVPKCIAQDNKLISRDKLIKDVRLLVKIIESTHPDPYVKGGGKIAFHRRFHKVMRSIPKGGMTAREFYRLLRPLVASVGDAHTVVTVFGEGVGAGTGLPFGFEIVEDDIYIARVYQDDHKPLIGARISRVEGVSIVELVNRQGGLKGFENRFGNLINLVESLGDRAHLACLLPEWDGREKMLLSLLKSNGTSKEITVQLNCDEQRTAIEPPSKLVLPKLDSRDPSYGFVGKGKEIAILRIDNMVNYREAIEHYKCMGLKMAESRAREVYKHFHGEEIPQDLDSVIAGIPAVTDTFRALAEEMKAAGTESLIVDLRNNQGGDSLMSDILVYFLYGWDIYDRVRDGYSITKYSKLHFLAFPTPGLEEINKNRSFPFVESDYNFDYLFERIDKKSSSYNRLKAFSNKSPTFAVEVESGKYEAYYCPDNVLVLTSPHTFSSAFWLVADLHKAGAKIAGTPSSQSGNSFGDVISFDLANSGIRASVSYKQFVLFPNDPEKGEMLKPDIELTYEKLASYNFDPNAEILLALEAAQQIEK